MKKLILVLFLLLLSDTDIRAEKPEIGILTGYDVLTGDAGKVSDDGISIGIIGDYFIDKYLALEASLLFSQHDDVVDDQGSHTHDLFSFLLGPKFLFPKSSFTPCLSFGPSLYMINYKFDPEGTPGLSRKDDDTEAGLFASAGIDIPLHKNLSLGFRLTYHYIFNTDVMDGDMLTSGVTLGLRL